MKQSKERKATMKNFKFDKQKENLCLAAAAGMEFVTLLFYFALGII